MCVLYPSIEVGGDLAQADSGVATDWALFISGLQPGKMTHQFLVQVGLIQLGSQQQHRLETEKKKQRRIFATEGWQQSQVICNNTTWFVVMFIVANYLNGLFPDGRVGVCEAVNHVRENLGVDCCLIQILNELLHLKRRRGENNDGVNVYIL